MHDPAIKAGPAVGEGAGHEGGTVCFAKPPEVEEKEKPPISPEKLLKQDRQRAAKAAKHALEAEAKRKEAAMTPEERRRRWSPRRKRLERKEGGRSPKRSAGRGGEGGAAVEHCREAEGQAALDADAVTPRASRGSVLRFCGRRRPNKRGAASIRERRSECAGQRGR